MPRHRRLEIAGGIYHVIARGLERRAIFKDDQDREEFLRRLEEGLKKTGSKCLGWVLMPNHFHLLIRSGIRPLSDLMRKVLTGYAVYFNHRYRRSGYLYQNRYKSILCHEETYLLELVRYIHLNPLRAQLVKDIGELNIYKWCGHSVIVGSNKNTWQSTGEILERFGNEKSKAINKYIEFITDAKDTGKRDDLTGGGLRRSAGGWKGVYELMRAKEYWRGDERVLGDGNFVDQVFKTSEEDFERREKLKQKGWDLEKLTKVVCEQMSIKHEDLMRKWRDNKVSDAKKIITHLGCSELGINGTALGKYFNITKQAVAKLKAQGEVILKNYDIKLSS